MPTSSPLKGAFLPGIVVAHDQDEDEHQHLDQAEEQQLVEDDGPRKHEDGLDVEDDEQHRHEVVPDAVPLACPGDRLDAALVRLELHLVVFFRADEPGNHKREKREAGGNDDENGDRNVRRRHWEADAESRWFITCDLRGVKKRTRSRKTPRFPATHTFQTSFWASAP